MKLSNEQLAKANIFVGFGFLLAKFGGIALKKTLRRQMIDTLKQMSAEDYEARSRKILDRLINSKVLQGAQTIACTMSNFPEVETRDLIRYLWKNQKTVVVPKCDVKSKKMRFYTINSFEQLEIVYAGIEEPIPALTQLVDEMEIDAVIVPGVLFNRAGYRVGFGGGYYDRFLANYRGITVSLAFDEQVVAEIPLEAHDLPVQTLVTDVQIYNEVK